MRCWLISVISYLSLTTALSPSVDEDFFDTGDSTLTAGISDLSLSNLLGDSPNGSILTAESSELSPNSLLFDPGNDYLNDDPNGLLSDTDTDGCSSASSPLKVRVRGDACASPFRIFNSFLDSDTTAERVRRYWCSETTVTGFGNIAVCNKGSTWPSEAWLNYQEDLDIKPSQFLSLPDAYLSRSI